MNAGVRDARVSVFGIVWPVQPRHRVTGGDDRALGVALKAA